MGYGGLFVLRYSVLIKKKKYLFITIASNKAYLILISINVWDTLKTWFIHPALCPLHNDQFDLFFNPRKFKNSFEIKSGTNNLSFVFLSEPPLKYEMDML